MRMRNRENLLQAIQDEVFEAVADGRTIDVNALAISLSSKFTQSGLTLNQICAEIEGNIVASTPKNRPPTGGGGIGL